MHYDFIAEGIMHDMDLFEKFLQTIPLKLPITDSDGKTKEIIIQSQLRQKKLYSFVFPKEYLDQVINTLGQDLEGLPKGARLQAEVLRKALKLKKVPKSDKTKGAFPIYRQNLRIVPLGIREDPVRDVMGDGRIYEAL